MEWKTLFQQTKLDFYFKIKLGNFESVSDFKMNITKYYEILWSQFSSRIKYISIETKKEADKHRCSQQSSLNLNFTLPHRPHYTTLFSSLPVVESNFELTKSVGNRRAGLSEGSASISSVCRLSKSTQTPTDDVLWLSSLLYRVSRNYMDLLCTIGTWVKKNFI